MYEVRGRGRGFLRTLAVLLIAGVALLRGVVPAGFMLASANTPDGRFFVLELCDAHQQPSEAINLDTGEKVALADLEKQKLPSKSSLHSPCVFAATAFFPGASTPEITPRLKVELASSPLHIAAGIKPARASQPPPATGPPALI